MDWMGHTQTYMLCDVKNVSIRLKIWIYASARAHHTHTHTHTSLILIFSFSCFPIYVVGTIYTHDELYTFALHGKIFMYNTNMRIYKNILR